MAIFSFENNKFNRINETSFTLEGVMERRNIQAALKAQIDVVAPKIVLVSANFSKELTTSVMWLNERSMDIRCVRLIPYRYQDKILVDVQQIMGRRGTLFTLFTSTNSTLI